MGEGQETSCTLLPRSLPGDLHHCAASTAGWMGHGHWSSTNWGIARLGRVLISLGQPLAVQTQPGHLYSHSSVPASLVVPCCSHAPCRTQQCGAKPGMFLYPPNPLNPMGKADSSPGSHWDPYLRARTEAWTWDCQDSCRQVYSSTGLKWGTQDGIFPAHLARPSDITSKEPGLGLPH